MEKLCLVYTKMLTKIIKSMEIGQVTGNYKITGNEKKKKNLRKTSLFSRSYVSLTHFTPFPLQKFVLLM